MAYIGVFREERGRGGGGDKAALSRLGKDKRQEMRACRGKAVTAPGRAERKPGNTWKCNV